MNAIILAGGRGSRLAPWHAPKCLIPVNGKPILHRILRHLGMSYLVKKVVVCVGYKGRDVEESLQEYTWEINCVMFSDSGFDVPMGKRLQDARLQTNNGRVLICYGDELANVNIKDLIGAHAYNAMTFTMVKTKVPGGTVIFNDNNDPRIVEGDEVWTNIGFVVVEPQCWQYLSESDGLSDWVNRCAKHLRVGAYVHTGLRTTINTLADLEAAEAMW